MPRRSTQPARTALAALAAAALAAGLVSIHFTNAVSNPPMVAPYGGAQGRFLTNPFTVGIPRRGADPILLDFATSAIAHGKARVAYNKKVPVPPGGVVVCTRTLVRRTGTKPK